MQLDNDEVWEIMRCVMSLPISYQQADWLFEKRERVDFFDLILRALRGVA